MMPDLQNERPQMSLPLEPPLTEPAKTIQERFEADVAARPSFLHQLAQRALELKRRGWKHYGIKALIEVARYHWNIEQGIDKEWKINNDFTSRYARRIMELYPELEDFFETRELKSE